MTDMMITVKMPLWQKILGWIMIVMHLFLLYPLILLVCDLLDLNFNPYVLQIIDFIACFVLTFAIFFPFLKANFKTFGRSAKKSFLALLIGLAVLFALNFAVNTLIDTLAPADYGNANEAALDTMAQYYYWPMVICTAFIVPITEEVLYRGVVHQILYQRSRILAYVISTFVFAFIHVFGYIGVEGVSAYSLFLSFHTYLPAGIALALSYELSDSIWVPIMIHSINNFIAMVPINL